MEDLAVSATSTPARSQLQRLEALARANAIRTQRSQLKERLRKGEERLEEVLLCAPGYLHTAKVAELLMSVPKVGPVRAAKIMQECRVSAAKTVIGLTPRQRAELVTHLRD